MVHAPVRTLCAIIIITLTVLVGTGCTPAQVEQFLDLGERPFRVETATEPQLNVIRALQDQQAQANAYYLGIIESRRLSTDCGAAMRAVWPQHLWGWADGIMHRESRHFHAADNPTSSASGCWQLLSSLHADKYAAVGCHVSQWADAVCNNKAAYRLYQLAGKSPWNL
jgi:hypothetical protein